MVATWSAGSPYCTPSSAEYSETRRQWAATEGHLDCMAARIAVTSPTMGMGMLSRGHGGSR